MTGDHHCQRALAMGIIRHESEFAQLRDVADRLGKSLGSASDVLPYLLDEISRAMHQETLKKLQDDG